MTMDEMVKEGVLRIHQLAWVKPDVQLPADSHLESVVIDIFNIYARELFDREFSAAKGNSPL